MVFDQVAADGAVGDHIVEAFHQQRLGQHRQLFQWPAGQSRVKVAVKPGVLAGEGPQLSQLPRPVDIQFAALPPLPGPHPAQRGCGRKHKVQIRLCSPPSSGPAGAEWRPAWR